MSKRLQRYSATSLVLFALIALGGTAILVIFVPLVLFGQIILVLGMLYAFFYYGVYKPYKNDDNIAGISVVGGWILIILYT